MNLGNLSMYKKYLYWRQVAKIDCILWGHKNLCFLMIQNIWDIISDVGMPSLFLYITAYYIQEAFYRYTPWNDFTIYMCNGMTIDM